VPHCAPPLADNHAPIPRLHPYPHMRFTFTTATQPHLPRTVLRTRSGGADLQPRFTSIRSMPPFGCVHITCLQFPTCHLCLAVFMVSARSSSSIYPSTTMRHLLLDSPYGCLGCFSLFSALTVAAFLHWTFCYYAFDTYTPHHVGYVYLRLHSTHLTCPCTFITRYSTRSIVRVHHTSVSSGLSLRLVPTRRHWKKKTTHTYGSPAFQRFAAVLLRYYTHH